MTTRRESGMTLIELMIAVGIAAILATAVFSLFFIQARGVRGQQNVVDLQDNARVALDVISRDIRNAGFFITPSAGVRIEDNCATANLFYNSGSTPPWSLTAGTAVETNGDNQFYAGNDACPNGSDRISIGSRPRTDTVSCNNGVQSDCSSEPGGGTIYRIPCDSCTPSDPGIGCNATLEKICPGCSQIVNCTGCPGGNPTLGKVVSICSEADPTLCADVNIDTVHCCDNAAGPTCGSGSAGLQLKITHPWDNSFSGSDWNAVGGHSNPADIAGVNHRTYQILDVDGDGSTELVYSDTWYAAMGMAGTGGTSANALPTDWTVVAYGVEDLQFAYAFKSAPTTWVNGKSLWEIGGCTNGASVECLQAHYGTDPLIAVRVSMVVRSATPETGLDAQLLVGGRPALENNTASTTPKGYRRRILSTVIGTRNLNQ